MARTAVPSTQRKAPPEPPANAPEAEDSNPEEEDLFPQDADDPVVQPGAPAVQPAAAAVQPAAGLGTTDEDLAKEFYKNVLSFTEEAANSLVHDQQLTHPDSFLELDDDDIDNICQAIRKPGGAGLGAPVAIICVTRLKLLRFYAKLNERMSRRNPRFDKIQKSYLDLVMDQRKVELDYAKTKSSMDPKPLTLDLATAPACFEKVKTLLSSLRGSTGTILRYVIREDIRSLPHGRRWFFGQYPPTEEHHSNIDLELIDRAPILSDGADPRQLTAILESVGPFSSSFSIDMKTVWNIMFALFGHCPCWQHVKKYTNQQNGRKAWLTLQNHFFGGDKATTLYQACINRLASLRYDTDRKNWNFEKYLMSHVKEHNTLDSLHTEYGQQKMPEAMKIKYFQDGITDTTFNSVRLSIQANPTLFQDFDTIKDQYLTFKRTQQCLEQTIMRSPSRSISEVGRSGAGRGGRGRGDGILKGRGSGTRDERRQKGLPNQADVDRCTHIVDRKYSAEEFAKFTAAEKQRLYQLRQKNRGTGRSGGEQYSSSVSEAGTKRPSDADRDYDKDDYDQNDDRKRNRDNDALRKSPPSGRQVNFKSEK